MNKENVSFGEASLDKNTVLLIGEFAINWALFDQKYYAAISSRSGNEVDVFKKKRNEKFEMIPILYEIQSCAKELSVNFKKYLMKKCNSQEINSDYVKDNLFTPQHPGKDYEHEGTFKFINQNIQNFKYCILCVERLRNNMFHGQKDIPTLSEQDNVFKAANDLLKALNVDENYVEDTCPRG